MSTSSISLDVASALAVRRTCPACGSGTLSPVTPTQEQAFLADNAVARQRTTT